MAGYQAAPQEREDNTLPSPETFSTRQNKSHHRSEDRSALFSGRILDRADSKVYAIVGVCFLLAAILAIMEMLGTVIHYLQVHTTSLRPFLFIGMVSATRSILSIGARLSVEGLNFSEIDFTHAMIELGVSAAVIVALGITLKLLGRLVEVGVSS